MITLYYAGIDDLFAVDAVLGYEFTRRSRNVIHELIDNRTPAVTLREAATRSGRMTQFYVDESQAREALRVHGMATVFQIFDDAHPELALRYVVTDDIVLSQDTTTMRRWTLTVAFREVAQ